MSLKINIKTIDEVRQSPTSITSNVLGIITIKVIKTITTNAIRMGIKMIGITTIEVMMEDGSEVKEDKTNTITEIDRIVVAIKGTAMEVEVIGVIINEIIGGKIIITRVIETSNLTSVEGLNKTNSIKI